MRTSVSTLTLVSLMALATACGGSDYRSDEPVHEMVGEAPTANSPYEVELVGSGQTLPTYAHKGRFYVLGQVGQRYAIRVKNPTPVRVEAIISVDGLDVIDGETANSNKRGYVVGPHQTITIDGFRVSTSHVAAFRFSSVDNSYAGRKGKARNVGVIGVAIFAEQARETLVVPQDRVSSRDYNEEDERADYSDGDDDDSATPARESRGEKARAKRAPRRPAPPPSGVGQSTTGTTGGAADSDYYEPAPTKDPDCCGPRTNRPGLGTEYGERRYSAVGFTRFVRASSQPTAYAELRYNNAAGLAALGVMTGPGIDDNELTRRETAEPFPGQRFSQPPQ